MDNQGAGKGTATNKSLQGKAKFLWPWQRPLPEFTTEKMIKAIHFWDIIPTISLNHQPVLQNLLARVTCEWWLLEQTAKWPASTSSKVLLCWQERNLSIKQPLHSSKTCATKPKYNQCKVGKPKQNTLYGHLFLPSRNLQAVKQLRWPRLRKPDLNSTKLVDLHPVERFKNLEWDELSKVMSNVSASWLVEPFFCA